MKVKDWLITFLISSIPVINVIMLFVWAFGDGNNEAKKTWAKAALIWIAIIVVLYFAFFATLIGGILSAFTGVSDAF